jgi:hypothetical protein
MKGKSAKGGVKVTDSAPTSVYAGKDSNVAKEAVNKAEGFKKGGKAVKMMGDKGMTHAGRKPRKAGGSVLSSAAGGSPRAKSSHY